jgi:hypothetical protein
VEKRMKRWAKKNRWRRFLRAGSVDDDIASSTAEINRTVEKLQVSPWIISRSAMADE